MAEAVGGRDGPGPPGEADARPYDGLGPDLILAAVERSGLACDGRFLALNSYENRVYQVGVEDGTPVVVKFYRPGRWSDEAIVEEHEFAFELVEREIPVVAPIRDEAGRSLLSHGGFRYAIFPRRPGGWPELDDPGRRRWMGRFIARIHAVGCLRPFLHRPALDADSFGERPRAFVLEHGFAPMGLEQAYADASAALVEAVRARFEAVPSATLRLHGDCHPGNVLWSDDGPAFVDLDDCRPGPAIQDLWMLLSGDRDAVAGQLRDLLEGYRDFHDFSHAELALIEPLRGLRLIHYTSWLARRWVDPAFPLAFPWFESRGYWENHVEDLRRQLEEIDAPVPTIY